MDKQTRINLWYLVFAVIAIWALQDLLRNVGAVETIPYSRFESLLDEDAIEAVTVHPDRIEGRYRVPRDSGATRFVTVRVPPEVVQRLKAAEVAFEGARPNTLLLALLSWVLPALLLLGLWLYVVRGIAQRQGMGGMMAVGKSRAKVYVEKDTGKTFADVAGVDEAKAELQEIVDFLKDPQRYGRLGARIPKGVLLVGPPGTGKTLMARAVAGEAGVPFFSISGSEFVEMFVGVGAARVRDLFEQASQHAPAIIFIDELDALGRARGSGHFSGNEEREQTLNQLLVELDGFDTSEGLVLLAATNRPEILDPALLRAGRFDRQVLVDRPDKTGRVAILRVHMKAVDVDPGLDAEQIAALTTGFTGADLANLVNEAALLATRERCTQVTLDHFTRAIERIVAGLEKKNRLINPQERRAVAFHEMGHALVSLLLPGVDPVHKVSIIPRGIGSLGYTIQRPTEGRYLMTQRELEHKIAVLLAGRAAEMLVFDALSTGASDDLAKATDIARTMVMTYGMDQALGNVSYEQPPSGPMAPPAAPGVGVRTYSEATAAAIDAAVARIIADGFERASSLLARNRALLERSAEELLERETLDQAALEALLAQARTEQGTDGRGASSLSTA